MPIAKLIENPLQNGDDEQECDLTCNNAIDAAFHTYFGYFMNS